ncbi:MAG: DUF3575 domain-containing protein [Bacteroidaceae bacterium]|jgi:hypothetical protein
MDTTMKRLLLVLLLVAPFAGMKAQEWAVKTNLLYWGMLGTANAEVEKRIGARHSLQLEVGYNPFTYSENKKLKHISIKPGYRYWLCEAFSGHFLSAQLEYAHFNAGNVSFPFGLYDGLKDYRYQGDLGAIGVGYGYHWILSPHWSIEAEFAIGLAYAHYKQYECAICGSQLGSDNKVFLKPTRAAISVVYMIK